MSNPTGTRSITIIKDNEKLFVLSENALKRLSQNTEQKENKFKEAPKQVDNALESSNQEILDLREKNDFLWKVANGKLVSDINNLTSTQVKLKHEQICENCKNQLNECYIRNSSKPLLCSKLVKDFWNCVNSKKQIIN